MWLPDVNVLVDAFHASTPRHAAARGWLLGALTSGRTVLMPSIVLVGFVRIASLPKVFPGADLDEIFTFVRELLRSDAVRTMDGNAAMYRTLERVCQQSRVRGSAVTDAALASIALEHDADLVTFDESFGRFKGLRVVNPL